jgi:hypothetical protein
MELCHDELESAYAFLGVHIHRDAAAVIFDANNVVFLQNDGYRVAMAGHRLVDRVVHDLVYEVMESIDSGGSDIHAGALSDSLKTL